MYKSLKQCRHTQDEYHPLYILQRNEVN